MSKGWSLRDETFDTLLKVKIEICSETLRFLNNTLVVAPTPPLAKPTKVKKPFGKFTSLTQNQIVILFHYLRMHKCIGEETPNNLYAEYISELTGFSAEKIRQNLSHISSHENSEFLKTDYYAVKRVLDKVICSISADFEENSLQNLICTRTSTLNTLSCC